MKRVFRKMMGILMSKEYIREVAQLYVMNEKMMVK